MGLINIDCTDLEANLSTLHARYDELHTRLTTLEALQPVSIPHGLRGLWVQYTNDRSVARDRVKAAADVGANAVFCFCGTGRNVTFANRHNIANNHTLTATLAEAQIHNISIYPCLPSKYFWRVGYPDQDLIGKLGITEHWLDFRNADARALIADLCYDVAQYNNVAGIILDYTRFSRHWYPDSDLTPAPITATIHACQQALQPTGKPLTASPISIYGDSQWSALNYGQAWHDWLDRGLVPWLTPMVYNDQAFLEARLDEWTQAGYFPQRTAPILSPSSWKRGTEIPKTDDAWRQEIRTTLAAGAHALVVFDQRTLHNHPAKANILQEEW